MKLTPLFSFTELPTKCPFRVTRWSFLLHVTRESFESDGRLVSQTSRFLYLEEVADTLLQEVREYGNGVRNVQSSLLHRLVLYGARFLYLLASQRLTFIMLFGLSLKRQPQWRDIVDQAARPFQFITILLFNESSENLGIRTSTKITQTQRGTCPRFSPYEKKH
jgi:hypothetical protein